MHVYHQFRGIILKHCAILYHDELNCLNSASGHLELSLVKQTKKIISSTIYNDSKIIYFCSRCPQQPCCVGTSNLVWFCRGSHECNSATMGGYSSKLPLVTVLQFHTADTYLWLSVLETNFFLRLLFSIEFKHRVDAYNSWWFLKLNLTSCSL
jgi:hypothetical protein